MSYETERADIENRFATLWGATCPVAYSNVAFSPPADSEWARLTILDNTTDEIGIGQPGAQLHRFQGLIIVSVFSQLNKGEKKARQLADLVFSIFKSADFGSVTTWAPSLTVIGESDGYFQVNVTINFKRDEIT